MKKRLSLLLALVMLSATIASCGGSAENTPASTKSASKSNPSSSNTTDFSYIDEYIDDLKIDRNYDGQTFTIIGRAGSDFPEKEEITGALENDALYDRSRALESAFGIDLEYTVCDGLEAEYQETPGFETTDLVKQDQDAGLNSYDLIMANIQTCGQILASGGYLHTVNDLDPIDLDNTWWNTNLREQFLLEGNLYYLSGKACLTHYTTPACILFSKKIATDYNIQDPYELVKNNEWTVDKFFEVASAIPGGGGVYRYSTGSNRDGLALYFGAGFTITENDPETGNPYLPTALTGEQVDLIDKLGAELSNKNYASADADFTKDEILFLFASAGTAAKYRSESIEFGVLPMPKNSSAQERYYSYETSWSYAGLFIPHNVNDEEFSAVITEAMGAYSEKYIEPQFYEKMLKSQSVYDLASKDMLDIIYSSSTTDLVDIYQWGGSPTMANLINYACNGTEIGTVVSSYASAQRMVNLEIKQLIKMVKKMK